MMDFWRETNWYAVQTKPYHEKLAEVSVANLDAEVFLPRIRREQLVGGFPRFVIRPLFPGYFFVRFCPVVSLDAVQHAHGVTRVVGTKRFPIPLDLVIIASIRGRVQPDGFISTEARTIEPGKKVVIEQGSLAGWMGRVERELDDGRRVSI